MNEITKKWNDLLHLDQKLQGEKLDEVCRVMEGTAEYLINGENQFKYNINQCVFPVILGLMTKRGLTIENHIELCNDLNTFFDKYIVDMRELAVTGVDAESLCINKFIEEYDKGVEYVF